MAKKNKILLKGHYGPNGEVVSWERITSSKELQYYNSFEKVSNNLGAKPEKRR